MRTYEKIETLYSRDIEGTKKLIPGVYRNPTVEFLKDCKWVWTEKVDGTNVRVYWDGHTVSFGGRTDKAQMPVPLVNKLNSYFGGEENAQVFEQMFGEKEVILFGEGYGHKIQAAGDGYNPTDVGFALFDVMIGDNYQPRTTVENVAAAFKTNIVPIVGVGTLDEAVEYVMEHHPSVLSSYIMYEHGMRSTLAMEGIVCRPEMELRDRCGNRVIVKIKWNDFKDFVKG